jgi:hypothetical protein
MAIWVGPRLNLKPMIFIPCESGPSHNETEAAAPQHITAGVNVLLHAILEQAGHAWLAVCTILQRGHDWYVNGHLC